MFIIGCSQQKQESIKWKVSLVRPDGGIHQTWTIESNLEPKVSTMWSGHTALYSDSGYGWTDTKLIAPSGWAWKSELIEKE